MVGRLLVGLALVVGLSGCAEELTCASGSMLDSPGGLELRQAEHPTGWGVDACEACHIPNSLHRLHCTEDVDLQEVRDIVAAEGTTSCASCHGTNGVRP
jgi:hypothetical protein